MQGMPSIEFFKMTEGRLNDFKNNYPNLQPFTYDSSDDTLVFGGNKVYLNGIGLDSIDPVFFSMPPQDIFEFLKNRFYRPAGEIMPAIGLIGKTTLSSEDERLLEELVSKTRSRIQIYLNNKDYFDSLKDNNKFVQQFITELEQSKEVLAQIRDVSQYKQEKDSEGHTMDNSQQPIMEKPLVRTRVKPGFNDLGFDEQEYMDRNNKLGTAGYTSIILIIAITIIAGIYLATTIFP